MFRDKGTYNNVNAWKIKTDRYPFFFTKSHWTFQRDIVLSYHKPCLDEKKGCLVKIHKVQYPIYFQKLILDRQQQATNFRFNFNDTVSCAITLSLFCQVFLYSTYRNVSFQAIDLHIMVISELENSNSRDGKFHSYCTAPHKLLQFLSKALSVVVFLIMC